MKRVALALLALPLVVIALAVVVATAQAQSGAVLEAIANLRYQALWYALITYMCISILAVPGLVVAWRRGWLSWWHSVVFGALVGVAAFLPPLVPTLLDDKLHTHYRVAQLWTLHEPAVVGALHGLLFWLLALWRNGAATHRLRRIAPSTPQA